MNREIPDVKIREQSLSRLKNARLMLDALNMTLDEAISSVESDARNNSINSRRRHAAEKLFANYKKDY